MAAADDDDDDDEILEDAAAAATAAVAEDASNDGTGGPGGSTSAVRSCEPTGTAAAWDTRSRGEEGELIWDEGSALKASRTLPRAFKGLESWLLLIWNEDDACEGAAAAVRDTDD